MSKGYQVRVASSKDEQFGFRFVADWRRQAILEMPDMALEPLSDIEGAPLGVMVRHCRLSDVHLLSLIARDIMIPARKADLVDPRTGKAYLITRLYDEVVAVEHARWVGIVHDCGTLWCEPESDEAQACPPEGIVEDAFDVTVGYSEELCVLLGLLQSDGSADGNDRAGT